MPQMSADAPAAGTGNGRVDPRATGLTEVHQVAEVHFHLRIRLEAALEAFTFTEEARKRLGIEAVNYKQYWKQSYSDRYFDMGTLQRLATAVETGLRHHHRTIAGSDLAKTATKDRAVFQALVRPERLLDLFQRDCGYDLSSNPNWQDMRLLMAHRHLYAHRSGLVDDKYLDDVRLISGEDLRPLLEEWGYPEEELLWFRPLSHLDHSIEAAKRFFRHFPADRPVPIT